MSKTVSVGQIVSIIVLAASVTLIWTNTQKSIQANYLGIQYNKDRINQQVLRSESLKQELNANLKAVNNKLDQLIVRDTGYARHK